MKEIRLDVLRRSSPDEESYIQSIIYKINNENATVATMLTDINNDPAQLDTEGHLVTEIRWEHSCLQRKCGACAMVINGVPGLACNSRLLDYKDIIRLEPLKKFPLIADLMVDRSILRENLKTIGAWLESDAELKERDTPLAFEASRCLQCGCCLEVCPNFYFGGEFEGMAAMVPVSRLITSLSSEEKDRILRAYRKHIYSGCGKSLSCRNICPAGLDIDRLLVRSNKAALWRKKVN